MDNRGNRLLAVDDSGINTPAIAAAHAIRRYNAQAADEISLEVNNQQLCLFKLFLGTNALNLVFS